MLCDAGNGEYLTYTYQRTRTVPEVGGSPVLCANDSASVTVKVGARSRTACALSCSSHSTCTSFNQKNCQHNSCSCDLYTFMPKLFAVVKNCQHWNKWLQQGLVSFRNGLKSLGVICWHLIYGLPRGLRALQGDRRTGGKAISIADRVCNDVRQIRVEPSAYSFV